MIVDERTSDGIEIEWHYLAEIPIHRVIVQDKRDDKFFVLETEDGKTAREYFDHPYAFTHAIPALTNCDPGDEDG